jgi:hypothetical protein
MRIRTKSIRAKSIRTKSLVLALLLSGAIGGACAQDFVFGWNPRTGDVWVDQTLGDINAYGGRYRESFIDELVRYHGAPRDYVTTLLVEERWAPGDVYYACAIAQIVGRSCRYVAEEWERDHGQGWGALAQRMGIKPGSDEFHRLKNGFAPVYQRWSRPLHGHDKPGKGHDKGHKPGKGSDKGNGKAKGRDRD